MHKFTQTTTAAAAATRRLKNTAFTLGYTGATTTTATTPRSKSLSLSAMSSNSTTKVKVAILDDYASIAPDHFKDLASKIEIQSFPETLNARVPAEHDALIKRLRPFTVVSSMRERTQFPKSVLSALPNLKVLLTTGSRNAAIDMAACAELGVTVVGTGPKPNAVKGYDATNEMTWALILAAAKDVVGGDAVVKASPTGWQTTLVAGLAGKTLGLLGLGKLGTQAAATGALGFGMKVLAWSNSLTQEKADEAARSRGLPAGTFQVATSKRDLFERADVLSVHYVLSERSKGIVGADDLAAMKKSAVLVNTSRGPLVDESALVGALESGAIRAAGLDVFDTEPLPEDSPWRKPSNHWGTNGRSRVVISPHMGYVEEETMHGWYEQQMEALKTWLEGGEMKGIIR